MLSAQRRNFWILLTVVAVFVTAAKMFNQNSHGNYSRHFSGSTKMNAKYNSCKMYKEKQEAAKEEKTTTHYRGCSYRGKNTSQED